MKTFALTVAFLASTIAAFSVSATEKALADPLFQANDLLNVTLTAPFSTLIDEKPTDEDLPGLMSYTGADGRTVELDVGIRTRGHFRHRTCDYPPLWLNLKKSQLDGTLFDGQNKVKLVVHCDSPARYEQTVLREYLAYRLLNLLTDDSFRVRLLHVQYNNTEGKNSKEPRYGFLIEHKKRLAKRLGREELEIARAKVSAIQGEGLNLMSLHAYMIGNTDFSPVAGPGNECCHNYVLFGQQDAPIMAIAYDFDQSGFVDAPYAVPNQQLGLRSIKQRLYRGRCLNNKHVQTSIDRMNAVRDDLFTLVQTHEGLTKRTRKDLVRYMEDFFEIINDPKDVQRKIIKQCI